MLISEFANIVVALGTASLAVATWRLSNKTARSVEQQERGLEQQERHHRDKIRPYCTMAFDGADRCTPFGVNFLEGTGAQPSESPDRGPYLRIKGTITNKGFGPAKHVVVYLNMRRGTDVTRLTKPRVVIDLLAANTADASVDIRLTDDDVIKAFYTAANEQQPRWHKTTDIGFVANDAYEVVLEYKNVFDETYRTVHAKGLQQNMMKDIANIHDKAYQDEMAIRAQEPLPSFLVGQQGPSGSSSVDGSVATPPKRNWLSSVGRRICSRLRR